MLLCASYIIEARPGELKRRSHSDGLGHLTSLRGLHTDQPIYQRPLLRETPDRRVRAAIDLSVIIETRTSPSCLWLLTELETCGGGL